MAAKNSLLGLLLAESASGFADQPQKLEHQHAIGIGEFKRNIEMVSFGYLKTFSLKASGAPAPNREWPRYDEHRQATLMFDVESRTEKDPSRGRCLFSENILKGYLALPQRPTSRIAF